MPSLPHGDLRSLPLHSELSFVWQPPDMPFFSAGRPLALFLSQLWPNQWPYDDDRGLFKSLTASYGVFGFQGVQVGTHQDRGEAYPVRTWLSSWKRAIHTEILLHAEAMLTKYRYIYLVWRTATTSRGVPGYDRAYLREPPYIRHTCTAIDCIMAHKRQPENCLRR